MANGSNTTAAASTPTAPAPAPTRKPRETFPHTLERKIAAQASLGTPERWETIEDVPEFSTTEEAVKGAVEYSLTGTFRVVQVKREFTTKKVEKVSIEIE